MVVNLLMLRSKFRSRNPVGLSNNGVGNETRRTERDNGTHQERPQFVKSADASAETDGGIRYVAGERMNERWNEEEVQRGAPGARVFRGSVFKGLDA